MTPEIEALPFDQLRSLHREIGALIAQKRHEALEQLKGQIEFLGFTVEDIAGKKKRGRKPKQREETELTE
jgi:chaperonin cofactor prefoldin